ncbi:MAG: F0F1 ATP synthase subunit B' [Alphaproteobacteria bacterium]|nr:F0F1 ATP synthase subunit B' [Alphaproteobacteria bacterium]
MAETALLYVNAAPPEDLPPAPADSGIPPLPDSPVTSATTEVPVEHKVGLPQLNVETFAGQLFWLAVSLIVLFLVISRLGVPKIGGVMAARAGRIKGDIDAAADSKRKSEEALARYEKALADARARALKIGDDMRKVSQDEADAKNAAEAERVAAETAKAEARIAEMRKAAMANVATLAGDVASEIVSKLTGEAAPASDVSNAVRSALKTA